MESKSDSTSKPEPKPKPGQLQPPANFDQSLDTMNRSNGVTDRRSHVPTFDLGGKSK